MVSSKTSLDNPYIIGRPIYEPECFFGRESLFAFIRDNLKQRVKVILLHGQRRIGKSSVLYHIPNFVNLDDFVFIRLSLEGKSQQLLGEVLYDFAVDIQDFLVDKLGISENGLMIPQRQSLIGSPNLFDQNFLPNVYQLLNQKNLVLLLDEFDVLGDHQESSAINHFFPYLHSIISNRKNDRLFIIPVIGRQLTDLPNLLNLFKDAPYQEVGLLQENDAKRLMLEPVKGIMEYEPDAIDEIFSLSAGHPYFTQVICFALFSQAREKNRWIVNVNDVKRVVNKAIEFSEGGLSWFYDSLPLTERLILCAVAEFQYQENSDIESILSKIESILSKYDVIFSGRLIKAKEKLADWSFIQSQENNLHQLQYKIKVDLVRLWLLKRHPFEEEVEFYNLPTEDKLKDLIEFTAKNKLTKLNLSGYQMTSLPESISQFTYLTHLDLSDNQLSQLPYFITQFNNLVCLNLRENQLSNFPELLMQLKNLQYLDLSFNQLTKIPEYITDLYYLNQLNLSNNPLETPPSEICELGLEVIRDYFQALKEQQIDYLYEAKLMILGEGGVGKTTLAQKIISPDYQLQEEDSTEGLNITNYYFSLNDKQEFKVYIWDFGGQEIYHETHQFFLTERSLYVLVVDTRKEDTDFYYWLNIIELLSDNSPVLIIKNEIQDRKKDINERQLISDFPNIKRVISANFATNRGLSEILTEIKYQIQQLPHVGASLPSYWVKIREILEKYTRNHISFNKFYQLCKKQGFKTLEDILLLSSCLHDLGIILHFQNDDLLTKTVILKPQWVTNAVYKVLDTPNVRNNLGRFNKEDLKQIWQAEEYRMMRGKLLRLMMNFKLCYEIFSQKDHYIAPQLLSLSQPDYSWDENDNLLLRYEYEFMPKGILTRFIVETHRNIENETLVWKTGVILTKDDTRAEIKELYRYHKGEIQIRVMGNCKRDLLTIVRNELDKIHASYKRLNYKTFVPCNCSECKGSQHPYFYLLDVLNKAIDRKVETVQCPNSFENVNPQTLVNDIGLFSAKIRNNLSNSDPVDVNVNQNNINQTHTGLGDNISKDKTVYNYYCFQDATFGGGFTDRDYYGDVLNLTEELLDYLEHNNPSLSDAISKINSIKDRQPEIMDTGIVKEAIQNNPTLKQRLLSTVNSNIIETIEILLPPVGMAIESIREDENRN